MAEHTVIFGHGAEDAGASGNGTNERDFLRKEFYPLLKKYAGPSVEFYDLSKRSVRETGAGRGIYTLKGKTVTEFHLDCASPSAKGGHVVIAAGFSPDAMDKRLADVIKKDFGWRGGQAFSARNDLANLNAAKRVGINYRLIEMCFISNSAEMAHLRKNLDRIARDYIEAITGEAKTVEATKPATTTLGKYRVYTGAFATQATAEKARKDIESAFGWKPFVKELRVWTGVFSTKEAAEKAAGQIKHVYGYNPQIRKED